MCEKLRGAVRWGKILGGVAPDGKLGRLLSLLGGRPGRPTGGVRHATTPVKKIPLIGTGSHLQGTPLNTCPSSYSRKSLHRPPAATRRTSAPFPPALPPTKLGEWQPKDGFGGVPGLNTALIAARRPAGRTSALVGVGCSMWGVQGTDQRPAAIDSWAPSVLIRGGRGRRNVVANGQLCRRRAAAASRYGGWAAALGGPHACPDVPVRRGRGWW